MTLYILRLGMTMDPWSYLLGVPGMWLRTLLDFRWHIRFPLAMLDFISFVEFLMDLSRLVGLELF